MLVILLILLALVVWFLSQRVGKATGLPAGRVVYTDTGGWGRLEKPLFSQRLQLTGKPDYLVRDGDGYIPVEVKSARAPAGGPYESHVYQLAAYCALVAEAYGRRPAYGLIKYADKTLAVDYTPALESGLMELLDDIRADSDADDAPRSHNSAARCRACGFREACGEALEG
ncbi:MAG TPA: CRISPR-associated protein Cas4 [Anaerolineales bacterium]|nr:CRISPR-associated protein Cas4 [Anaerolineales bacterium]